MSDQAQERKRLIDYARKTWGLEGHILPYALAAETLHESVRETSVAYFTKHKIKWWTSRWTDQLRLLF